MYYKYYYNSIIGKLIFISNGTHITKIILYNEADSIQDLKDYKENSNLKEFVLLKKWFDIYFSGDKPNIKIPLKLEGTPFQIQVWTILSKIPYGHTITYKEIASIIKNKNNLANMSAQAVGNAVGKNPLLILIPCHRVLGINNKLTGYRVGLNIKKNLLDIENIKYTE